MRPVGIVVQRPGSDLLAGVVEAKEQASLSSSSRMRPLKDSTNPFWVGYPRDIMPIDATILRPG